MIQSCEHCCTRIDDLHVRFGSHKVLDGVNLHINCRELVAVIGPNGAGKTTLLRSILKEIPYRGKIHFRVKGNSTRRPRIGYVPQKINFDYDSPISVLDLIITSLKYRPVWLGIHPLDRSAAQDALARVNASHLLHKRIGELSGGELQRVLLAIAMTPVPDLLLLDEAISAVDVKGLKLFYEIVCDLRKEYDVSIIMATHDLSGIAPHADRMILLNHSVIAEGRPQDVLANKKLVQIFGPPLWNISQIPGLETKEPEGDHHD